MRATLAVTIAAMAAAPALGEILHLPFHRLVNPHPAMARGLESEDLIARQFSHGGGSIHHGGSHGPTHGAPVRHYGRDYPSGSIHGSHGPGAPGRHHGRDYPSGSIHGSHGPGAPVRHHGRDHGSGSIRHGGSHGSTRPPVRHYGREVDEELVVRGMEIDDLD
ncbi:uncharacterized protein C8Q71DRAFT_730341 [Rhodofomes roseus]|uniref:Uncharacterized protein n=1 Tax=Rhodofomes roseus TaxID=34475 RepID=A0ABQ8KYL7_9APHY|nr:uncharacterized protein C8Q71DRAFT_730341 [Rhodofomes roseus]KAH9843861.1 hypothetical protein C8Q71DRAFT_730341 [Rhodofomes roseus]